MGFPMIQVFMIAARQVSKPIADVVINYGKNHPMFRSKVLIPVGRAIVRFTTRLRMKRLGLGENVTNVQVSEAAALEQASDFVQQVVLFSYSVGVFATYYFYTKITTPEIVKVEEFEKFRTDTTTTIDDLRIRLAELEKMLVAANVTKLASGPGTLPVAKPAPRFDRVSSLPIDSAVQVMLKDGSEFIVFRSGTSVGIEEVEAFERRGVPVTYRKKDLVYDLPRGGVIGSAERFVLRLFGERRESV